MPAKGCRFHLLDVFAEERYAGNRLAVVVLDHALGDEQMQRIAAEFDFPETTFVAPACLRDGAFDVRIFTPRREIPFAGHPTLGTAHVIRETLARGRPDRVVLRLKAGRFRVDRDPEAGLLWMRQGQPQFGAIHPTDRVARMLGIRVGGLDPVHPAQEASTGLPFLLVPLRTREDIRAARIVDKAYRAHFPAGRELPVYLFCRETWESGHHLHSRMFAPHFGIPEDPATGSAAGCLAGYILAHRYLAGGRHDLRIEQGYEMGRKSLLRVRARSLRGRMDIRVGGRVLAVGEGRLA